MDDKRRRRKSNNGTELVGAVLVKIWNPKKNKSEWIPGFVRGYVAGDLHENFQRINVTIVSSGIEINACHPDCVKEHLPFKI